MESQREEGAEPTETGLERSTIEFPYTDVENAQEIVHAVSGTSCTYEQLAAHLNAEPKGGGFRLRVSGAKMYGVIEYERGGTIRISDLGFKLMEAETERAAKRDAFLNIPLFNRVYEEFKGRQLPPQAGLERAIRTMGVGVKVADRARQVMLRSAKQAGFMDLQPDRLTLPAIREVEKSEPKKDLPPDLKTGGGTGGGGTGQHPFIDGLIQTLPKANSTWGSKERMNWLVTANSVFKMIYQSDDADEVIIDLKKGKTGEDPV